MGPGRKKNARRLSLERPALEREMRRAAVSAARLERAVERPMCVGVFGASQAGKSYLISALAKRGAAPLIVDFNGLAKGLDFLRLINPRRRRGIDRRRHTLLDAVS